MKSLVVQVSPASGACSGVFYQVEIFQPS